MRETIINLGLTYNDKEIPGLIKVTGEQAKLEKLRRILNDMDYVDDTSMAEFLFGISHKKGVIKTILITEMEMENNGYMVLSFEP